MSISISPVAMLLLAAIAGNGIMAGNKKRAFVLAHEITCWLFSAGGVLGLLGARPYFLYKLSRGAELREFDADFAAWAIQKFDAYAVVSIALTIVLILFLLLQLVFNKGGAIAKHLTPVVVVGMLLCLFASAWYGLNTLNKLFDVAGYIGNLSWAQFFVLYLPLAAKRMLARKG